MKHKLEHPDHKVKLIVNKALLCVLLKKNQNFEALVTSRLTELVRNAVDNELAQLID